MQDEEDFRKHKEHHAQSHWNWKFLNEIFIADNSTVRCMDIDGILHVNGNFLAIETKYPVLGSKLELEPWRHQALLFKALIATGRFTYIIAWGNGRDQIVPVLIKLEVWTKNGEKVYEKATTRDMVKIVTKWYQWAKDNPCTDKE